MQWFLRLTCAAIALVTPAVARADDKPAADLRYTTDVMGVAAGGERRGVRWMGRLDLDLDSGTDLFGVAGARAHADIFLLHGGGFSTRDAGDAQVVSNIDAPYAIRPFEAWVAAPLGGGVRAKAGLIDLNSEFDVQSVGSPFLNSSFGIAPDYSQSGSNGPSRRRAETAIEVTATRRLTKWLQVQPDVQYVRHPSWGAAADALVLELRLRFAVK